MRCCGRCGAVLNRYNREPLCAACTKAAPRFPGIQAPDHLLARPEIIEALRDWNWAMVLGAIIQATNASQAAIAAAAGTSQQHISRLLQGTRRTPTIATVRAICDGLGIPRQAVGLAPDHEEDATDRREFIGAAAAVAFTPYAEHERLTPARAEREVGRLRDAIPELLALNDRDGGTAQLCRRATDMVRKADLLVEHGLPTSQLASEGHAVALDLGIIAGWLHYDAEKHTAAKGHWQDALYRAQLVGDLQEEVYALESLSAQASYLGRPREGQQLAARAQQVACGWATARLRSLLLMREATAYAGQKAYPEFRRKVAQARHAYGDRSSDDPTWIGFYVPAELDGLEGLGYIRAGRPAPAEQLIRRALGEIQPNLHRNQIYYTAALGHAMAAAGDITGAAETLISHLGTIANTGSRRAKARIRQVCAGAAEANTTSARTFLGAVEAANAA